MNRGQTPNTKFRVGGLTPFFLCWLASGVQAQTESEERFFKHCPHHQRIQLHDERNPWDVHALFYSTAGMAELEVLRVVDGVIDAPLPGRPLKPFARTTDAIRLHYHQLPNWLIVERIGQFVDAFQLPELSLSDATTSYSSATGGGSMPGSGIIIRVHKLIDWTQYIIGDMNRLIGWPVGRRQGLVTWSLPTRSVDRTQQLTITTFHRTGVFIARAVDNTLTGTEWVVEQGVNVGRAQPHRQITVFLRMPVSVYRAHELWFLEHREQLVLGRAEDFASATHATLAHHKRRALVQNWDALAREEYNDVPIIAMTTSRVISRAPEPLTPFIVPAAWVLESNGSGTSIDIPQDSN